jgi:hypothetical protein
MYLEFPDYNLVPIIIISILFFMLFRNTYFRYDHWVRRKKKSG